MARQPKAPAKEVQQQDIQLNMLIIGLIQSIVLSLLTYFTRIQQEKEPVGAELVEARID